MKLAINYKSVEWWFWPFTLGFMIAGITGWVPGYYFVIGISGVQVIYFTLIKKSLIAFPTQVRIVYFIFTVIGLYDPTRIFYMIMAFSTAMVVLFDRCVLARVLVKMPWNKDVKLS